MLNEIQLLPFCSGREKQTAGGGYAGPLQACTGGGGLGGAGADIANRNSKNAAVNTESGVRVL